MMEIFLDEVNRSMEGEFDIYFKFIEKIASGSFGTVIRAIYLEQDREVAVKVIDKTKHKFKNLNRLKLEINILKQLKHKNIVEFIGCIETNSKMYIITEYIRDGTLKDFMNNRTKAG
jgi:serine/threonine protein kinase